VYCGKLAEWIWTPFGVVSGVGRGMGVLDGVDIVKGEGEVFGYNIIIDLLTDFIFHNRLLYHWHSKNICIDGCG